MAALSAGGISGRAEPSKCNPLRPARFPEQRPAERFRHGAQLDGGFPVLPRCWPRSAPRPWLPFSPVSPKQARQIACDAVRKHPHQGRRAALSPPAPAAEGRRQSEARDANGRCRHPASPPRASAAALSRSSGPTRAQARAPTTNSRIAGHDPP